ncbi:MAG: zinc-dependent metalloprotease, partial [Halobacteriovoraceae bacterium]|nr:zinc-dependent metalloprotease [Halobacteriovoraceae bacterium]
MMKNLGAILTLVILFVSCAKDRPVEIAQTSSHNLLEISDFQGKEFDLETLEAKSDGSTFTNANSVSVEKSSELINDFKLVSYKTDSPLFEDVPFFGKEKSNYKLKYEVTDKKLIIYKVASKSNLPFQEMTYATKVNNSTYKVPMVGYPVTLYKLVRRENINKELTHQLDRVTVYSLNEATHFDINYNAREDFDVVTKNNVFKADLFEGEWFYAATVVSASPEKANSIGRDVSMDFKARSVSRIKFVKRANGLAGLNLNIDENIDASDDINLQETINIPAEYFDYKIKKNGSKIELKEEKIGDDHPERVPFEQREYLELDFSQVISALTKGEGGLNKKDAILESLEIAKEYLGFVVYHPTDEVRIRYALRKAHTPLEGRVYYKDDRKVFGFFKTTKFAILNHRYEREDARQKLVKLNRFYPENGKITYYFSKTTPEHMKNAGRISIRSWDEAFRKAGTGIRITLDESKTVNLGDIRYNIINIVDTKDGARLLGYGPSIVDSESGEIISATSNIYANPFRESWISILRNYVRNKIGMFETTNIGVSSPEKMTFYNSFIDNVLEKANTPLPLKNDRIELLQELGMTVKSNIQGIMEEKKDLIEKDLLKVAGHDQTEGMFHFNSFDQNYKDAIETIEKTCGEQLENYITDLKANDETHNETELTVLNKCADVLLEASVVSTLVHELGHNFGLRHNFIASTDTPNFIYNEDGTSPSRTSSTMDYQPGNVTELLTPGPYDVAAIRFGYANKVLLSNGDVKDVDTSRPLEKQMEEKSLEIKKFKYCTDQDVQRVTPLCQRHDDGVTPQEIVENTIAQFNASYTLYGNRYDRANGPNSFLFGISQLSRTFIPLKMIYDQWRYYLREFLGEREQYLHRLTKKELKEKLEEMKNDTGKFGQYYKEYYKASEMAYNFLKEIIFTPAKTCVTKPKNAVEDHFVLLDFEELK